MLRFDNKLIRSILEVAAFDPTESHEWNILWSSSSCKSYLYEGLNEYQKIKILPIVCPERFVFCDFQRKCLGELQSSAPANLFGRLMVRQTGTACPTGNLSETP